MALHPLYIKKASAAEKSEVLGCFQELLSEQALKGQILHLVVTFTLKLRLSPTSSGRFAFSITLICTKGPWPVEVDGPEANRKRTLRPSSLNHLIGSTRPFGCAALKAQVSLELPLCYQHSAKITPILAAASWPVCSTVQSFGTAKP